MHVTNTTKFVIFIFLVQSLTIKKSIVHLYMQLLLFASWEKQVFLFFWDNIDRGQEWERREWEYKIYNTLRKINWKLKHREFIYLFYNNSNNLFGL